MPITESLISRLAIISLSTLAYRARRGCTKSSMYLTDRCLGACDLPFRDQVQSVDMDTAKEMLIKEYTEGLGVTRSLAEDMIQRMIANEELVGNR